MLNVTSGPRQSSVRTKATIVLTDNPADSDHQEISTITYSVTILESNGTAIIADEEGTNVLAEIKTGAITNPVTLIFDPPYVLPNGKQLKVTMSGSTAEVLLVTGYYNSKTARSN